MDTDPARDSTSDPAAERVGLVVMVVVSGVVFLACRLGTSLGFLLSLRIAVTTALVVSLAAVAALRSRRRDR